MRKIINKLIWILSKKRREKLREKFEYRALTDPFPKDFFKPLQSDGVKFTFKRYKD